ncbi:hypothetical protein R3W88_033369 [Solanum pinnatisectum]|uniref:Uncharacterized protein n=1 Tax=Solanum pinnatisectum TaxID=50273 RepID=A0AAV9K164_9SOLN|nr:hypothetical protein R3W88_033369 [Solanum pinnatisectum]
MSLLAIAQPSIVATSADCDSTWPWIKALTRSRPWGVAMDAKMKTPQSHLGGTRDSWILIPDKRVNFKPGKLCIGNGFLSCCVGRRITNLIQYSYGRAIAHIRLD